jgi:hypothetical protein
LLTVGHRELSLTAKVKLKLVLRKNN